MNNIEYYVIDPTGNITILVTSQVDVDAQPAVALKLMEKEPTCEQVGFVTMNPKDCDIALRMAGGEFCGNATLSTAALYMHLNQIREEQELLVSVSGVEDMVTVHMVETSESLFKGTVTMPKVKSVESVSGFDGLKVDLGGITHVVTELKLTDEEAEALVKQWAVEWHVDAVGLMQIDIQKKSMKPLVYVATANTLFWENSCASGTSAVGAAMAYRKQEEVLLDFKQPGGTLTVDAGVAGDIYLTGTVKICYKDIQ